MLFDVGEKPKKAKKAGRKAPIEPVKAPFAPPECFDTLKTIYRPEAPCGSKGCGCSDEDVAAGRGCGCHVFDLIMEFVSGRGEPKSLIVCVDCGCGYSVPRIPNLFADEEPGEYVFSTGKFKGLSVERVYRSQAGKEFLVWASVEHPDRDCRRACKAYLSAVADGGSGC